MKETKPSVGHKFVYKDSSGENIGGKVMKNKWNCTVLEDFDIQFCIDFYHHWQSAISEGETGHYALSLPVLKLWYSCNIF